MSIFSLRTALTLAGATLAVGLTAPAFAQSPKEDLVRCQTLYGQWARYNGASGYSRHVDADMALEDCRKGNTTAGIAELKTIMVRGNIPLPATETATSPSPAPSK
jgi:hypothetical protein